MNKNSIVELDDNSWEETVEKSDKPVFVMFYSPMCPHCKEMDPYFKEYSKDFKGKVSFVKVNVLNNPVAVGRYGVMGTPTFKFFCHGHPVQELVGAVYPTLMKKIVEESLQYGSTCVEKTSWNEPIYPGYA